MKGKIVHHHELIWETFRIGRNRWNDVKIVGKRPVYQEVDLRSALGWFLEKNREHNQEVKKSFHTEPSMSVGRYNPLTN